MSVKHFKISKMLKIIVGVYKKDIYDSETIVGVFIGCLENDPVIRIFLNENGEAELDISKEIKKITEGIKNYTIDFFDGVKIVNSKGKLSTFVKLIPYFSYEKVMSNLR